VKITFEGATINDIIKQMDSMVEGLVDFSSKVQAAQGPAVFAEGPGPETAPPVEAPPVDIFEDIPVDTPVEKPKEKAKPPVKEKSKPKAPAKKPVAAAPKKPVPPPPPPEEEEEEEDEEAEEEAEADEAKDEAPVESAPPVSDDDLVQIRVKTTADLQAAYANGFQKEVFELLSRFGNGAKSFREVPVEAFPAIREAIDNGALT
jgi:outer membrane biosynthesis protein TonB